VFFFARILTALPLGGIRASDERHRRLFKLRQMKNDFGKLCRVAGLCVAALVMKRPELLQTLHIVADAFTRIFQGTRVKEVGAEKPRKGRQ
jgi:hypothetical protein